MIPLPQRKSGLKALRVNKKRHLANLQIKTDLRKTVKKYVVLVKEKNTQEAATALKDVYKKLDKAAKRNVLNKNTASRRKSVLSKLLKNKV